MPEPVAGHGQDATATSTATASSLFTGNLPIQAALNELRLRLLDLTGRNRLINFKPTPGKSLQFVHSSIDGAYGRLLGESSSRVTITPLPEPDKADWVTRGARLVRTEPKDHAVKLGIDPSYELARRPAARPGAAAQSGAKAQALLYAEDLGKHCRKLEREAKSAIEETGANMLYLVFGMLEFPEALDSDKLYRAPLVCVPVSMTRVEEVRYSTFHLNYTGEELADNLSLREKVRRDFGLNLPEFDPDAEGSVEAYLEAVSEAVKTLPNWRVRRMMTLALLSFSNMLLVRDLDPDNWPHDPQAAASALLAHPLVKQVFEGRASPGGSKYADEYDIDTHARADLPLIYDADSSQHSALIDVLEGHNRVIEGPPGTGKSQTITNLIAAALQAGKKVLFVAEKLAALEVVKSRLALAGLAPFVLELHSNKINKKRVLEELSSRIGLRIASSQDLPQLLGQHEQKRNELKTYADLMNSRLGNQMELTVHQVLWRSELNRLRCGESAAGAQHLNYPAAPRTSATQLAALVDQLHYLAKQLGPIGAYGPSHALWGFFPTEFKGEEDLAVLRVLSPFATQFEQFATAADNAAQLLGRAKLKMSRESADHLVQVLESIAPADTQDVAFELLPRLFTDTDPQGVRSRAVLDDLAAKAASIHEAQAQVVRLLLSTVTPPHAQAQAADAARQSLHALGLGRLDARGLCERQALLRKAASEAQAGLGTLREAAQSVGLAFDDSQRAVRQVSALAEVALAAPRDSLHLQHPGLRGPTVVSVLRRGLQKLQENQQCEAALGVQFYLDALPSDDVLSQAISTLREGDAWYRFLQKRWRDAVRVHRQLQQDKSAKRNAAQRQHELEQIRQLRKDQDAWREDPQLRSAAGPHYSAEQTPLEDLVKLAQWVQSTDAALEAVQMPMRSFDATRLERATVLDLQARVPVLRAALERLSEFDERFKDVVANGAGSVVQDLSAPEWPRRLAAAESVAHALVGAQAVLDAHVRLGVDAEPGLRTVVVSHELPQMVAELAASAEGQALFGPAYAGHATDFQSALAAHTYGSLVTKAELPASIEKVLLSPDCVANHCLLTNYTNTIAQGWKAVHDFGVAMGALGRFEPATWANPTGVSTSEYARTLAAKSRTAVEQVGSLLTWSQYVGARDKALQAGLEGFVTRLESGAIEPDKLEYAFRYRFYAGIAQSVFDATPALRQFSGVRHSAVRQDFAAQDKTIIKLRGLQVAQNCKDRSLPPNGTAGARVDDKTEMELLRHLIPQQRPRVPVRQMLRRAGRAIQALKPCFMMGPQAVAQFLAPGHLHFDIVVMDEASQLRPEEAIGAIARGSQLVVVGDPKQLPPTSFFSRMNAVEDESDDGMGPLATSEAESILDVCISHFQPVRTLRWHYRSRHESLIAFSNQNFYRSNLVVFPSPFPKSKSLGLRYQYVPDGVYENQMNHAEARRVVDAAVEHILQRPHDSLGIATLNIKQRDLVAELLEERLRTLPEAVTFKERWDAEGMGLFIKNLENVQGDERDCILISTTFGKPRGANVVRQNFGPISREGGWRRLNVLFTRSRKSVAVFSSMRPEDIVLDARTPEGTRALRHYLEYARNGVIPADRETSLPPDSDFEMAVMDVLRGRGYEVEPQLGVAGFRIDIAVRHPEHRSGYVAAIECDGATYHSGVSVRDRDRIRQEILESLGWRGRIWRIWSTDWFRNPLSETERLLQFLQELRRQPLPEEYQALEVREEPVLASPAENAEEQAQGDAHEEGGERPEDLVFEDDGDEQEAEIGDLVTYAPADAPDKSVHLLLTANRTNAELGHVAASTPLGAVLMGATVGETVVLRVPGRPPQSFVIQSIRRSTAGAAQ